MQDEQFDYIDQGWAAMKETLDREMPVERRRRAIWWWLPVGIGALLLLGWAIWNMIPVTKSTGPDPVANSLEQLAPAETPEIAESFSDPSAEDSGTDLNATAIPESVKPAVVDQELPPDNTQTYRSVLGALPLLPSRLPYLSYEAPQLPQLTDMNEDPLTPFAPLTTNSVLLAGPQREAPNAVLSFKNRRPWEQWIEAGTHHGGTNWLSGGQAGILLRKPLGKWQFQTGLSLGIGQLAYERGSGLLNLSQSEQDNQVDPDVRLGNPTNVQAPLPADLLLLATQLRTQATIQRIFGSHWRIGLGVGVSYWVDTRRQWTYEPGNTFEATQENREFLNQFSGNNGQQVAETAFRSFGLSALGGVEYQFGPRWAAGLDYNFGLTNHSLVDGFVVYDRFGQVSVRYRIQ